MKLFKLNIVSLKSKIFSGMVKKLFVVGAQGEMQILVNHSPLLTFLIPGTIWFVDEFNKEQGFLSYGAILEVQKNCSTILADTIMREKDLDEKNILLLKSNIEKDLKNKRDSSSYSQAKIELTNTIAQLSYLRKIKLKKK